MPRRRSRFEEGVVYEEPSEIPVVPMGISTPPDFEDPNHPSRWKHRRRMAYMAMYSILVVTIYVLGPWLSVERITALDSIIEWFYLSMVTVVGSYMGFASISAVWDRRKY